MKKMTSIIICLIISIMGLHSVATAESPFSSKVNLQRERAYVINRESNNVSIIDTVHHQVIGTLPLPFDGGIPTGIAVNADGTQAFIAEEQTDKGSLILVVDTSTDKIIDTIPVKGNGLYRMETTPDGTHLYVAGTNSDHVLVIDTIAHQLKAMIPVMQPFGITISPDGARAYVGGGSNDEGLEGTISVIDTVTHQIIDTLSVEGYGFYDIALTPDGTRAYVAGGMNVSVIDTRTHQVIDTLPVESTEVEMTPDGTQLYVANMYDQVVSVIDVGSHQKIHTLPINSYPFGMTITSDGTRVYIANSGTGSTVQVINTALHEVIHTIGVGNHPLGIAIIR